MKLMTLSASRGEKDLLHWGHMYPLLSSSYKIQDGKPLRMSYGCRGFTNISQGGIDSSTHLGYAPFDYVAEMLVVDIVILSSNGPLCTFLQLILSMTMVTIQFRHQSVKSRILTYGLIYRFPKQPSLCSAPSTAIPFSPLNHHPSTYKNLNKFEK